MISLLSLMTLLEYFLVILICYWCWIIITCDMMGLSFWWEYQFGFDWEGKSRRRTASVKTATWHSVGVRITVSTHIVGVWYMYDIVLKVCVPLCRWCELAIRRLPIPIRLMCALAFPGKMSDQASRATNIIPCTHKYNYGVGYKYKLQGQREKKLKTKCGKRGQGQGGDWVTHALINGLNCFKEDTICMQNTRRCEILLKKWEKKQRE